MLAEQTPWIRVQTPDAGVLTDNSSNRGFQFIPEVGDQVMVSFEQGNPHRPYVSGSMYHGKNTKEVSNNIRSITTKSGSTIVFDDTESAEKITIKDKKGNIITFDSKDKSLSLQSPETINISAKNVKINAQENVEITAEKDIITHSKSETVINSEVDIDLVSQKNISLQSEERMTLRSDNTLAIEAQNKATLRADTALLQGTSLTELSGERIKLKGKSLAELMARLVKIN